ncbi:YjfB family protein [Bacillus sp. RG28]|uniref:YjfB family protein n=1 Tax=Gottfriedia endophytica TaxID=2820819 RepID=A0A940SH85_9BACI|nr:YjfB family protein [Gottfriedia endophytica]MBP0723695.1 YjfB family protein [Gottfriedia endophytica]
MDIAAISINMNQSTLQQNVSIALTKKAMETAQQSANQMIQMLQAPHPTLGNTIDLQA